MPTPDLNPSQQALLALLQHPPIRNRPPSWKRTKYEFVLDYGYWYDLTPRPKGIRLGRKNQCFANAFNLALNDDSLMYCEGFCVSLGGGLLVHHAWVTDGAGRVIDNSLKEPAAAYAGVPFNTNFVNLYHLKNEAMICLLDDHLHDWPMLGELGDRPDEWLEAAGRGLAKVMGD
jgi:hypothetical protein